MVLVRRFVLVLFRLLLLFFFYFRIIRVSCLSSFGFSDYFFSFCFFVSIYYFEVVVKKTRHCLVDPSALVLHCAGWYPEFADTCTIVSHENTFHTEKKTTTHLPFTHFGSGLFHHFSYFFFFATIFGVRKR